MQVSIKSNLEYLAYTNNPTTEVSEISIENNTETNSELMFPNSGIALLIMLPELNEALYKKLLSEAIQAKSTAMC